METLEKEKERGGRRESEPGREAEGKESPGLKPTGSGSFWLSARTLLGSPGGTRPGGV